MLRYDDVIIGDVIDDVMNNDVMLFIYKLLLYLDTLVCHLQFSCNSVISVW